MKHFISIVLFYFAITALQAQDKTVTEIRIDPVKNPAGVILRDGWRFYPGDNPAYAQPGFDDTEWAPISPAQTRNLVPPAAKADTVWLRVHFRADEASTRGANIQFYSAEAAEIFLDGSLVARSGIMSNSKIRAGYNVFSFTALGLTPHKEHVLAVRLVQQPTLKTIRPSAPFLSVRFLTTQTLVNGMRNLGFMQQVYIFVAGVLLLLSLMHLVFLVYNPKNKANKYFSVYALCHSVFFLLLFAGFHATWLDEVLTLEIIGYSLYLVGCLFAIRAVSTLFEINIKRWFAFLVCLVVLASISIVVEIIGFFRIYEITAILLNGTLFWLAIKGLKTKKGGAWLVTAGFAGGLLAVTVYISILVLEMDHIFPVINKLSIGLILLCPALGVSLFLAREFALNAKLLVLKLKQVEELSAQSLEQEREKQQLLASHNQDLEEQVAERTTQLQTSLNNLQAAQSQLIQAEKMASLGELTAGIAHEIQNPLNFVNNFSEVSAELLVEMEEELQKGDVAEALLISADLKGNLQKIHHHGKRADSIVKGMLQHSRTSTGERTTTNINTLANEFLKLSYHGLRAKDKSFNTDMVTDFERGLPKLDVVQQDIGRVLLNLFNNAFYAVQQKGKLALAGDDAPPYKPLVTVSTRKRDGYLEIAVRDNGTGIPASVKDKIMQPFFTTKPTGEGTGLGLSLSYDIITKGHGGSLLLESEENEFTQFTILLPATPAKEAVLL